MHVHVTLFLNLRQDLLGFGRQFPKISSFFGGKLGRNWILGPPDMNRVTPIPFDYNPLVLPWWIILHVCPGHSELHFVVGFQIKLTPRRQVGHLVNIADFIEARLPLQIIPLALLPLEHQEPC